jgi:hypothetical protein
MKFLKQVELPKNWLLNEVLLWVAFQRVSAAMSSPEEGQEIRDAEQDMFAYAGYSGDLSDWGAFLEDRECAAVGLPPDPRMAALSEGRINGYPIGEAYNDEELEREMQEWTPKYEATIEYPASRIFIALKEGRLAASGKLLPDGARDRALEILEARDERICDLPTVEIPCQFWLLSGIDWQSNAARNHAKHYCWIRCLTEDVLKVFPGEDRVPASGVERIGASFVMNEASESQPVSARPRGRPAFTWDPFHLEVANLLLQGELPAKKEAAIQHFQDWFERTLNQRPSRASIGQKLKLYYDRFVRTQDRK